MAQHDYVIANQSGAAFRSDLNNGLSAIVSQNSGSAAPSTTYAYMWWADTTTGLLKIRNAANSAWVTVGTLATTNLGLAPLASPTFTGTVTAPTFTASTGVNIPLGSAGSPSLRFTGDLDTGIYSPAANTIAFVEGGVEAMRIDSSGRVGIGITPRDTLDVSGGVILATGSNLTWGDVYGAGVPTIVGAIGTLQFSPNGSTSGESARLDTSGRLLVGTSGARSNFFGTTLSSVIQTEGTGGAAGRGALSVINNDVSNNPPYLLLGRSGAASLGSTTVVVNGSRLGTLTFQGADGTSFIEAATVAGEVDGTPGANDMPGRIVLSTTLDGAASPTERFRITNDGVIAYNQPAPAAVNATATLTVANLKTGIITSTSAAATDMTLPTGTDTQAGFSGTYNNFTFEWSVINTGPSLVRVLAGTAHTVVGSGSVLTGTSGRFASRRSAGNTFVTYRLA
jgi:hypothetical protein